MRKLPWFILFFLSFAFLGYSAPKHCRDCSQLPPREKKFAEQLSTRKRRIFCGQFNHDQRQATMRYAIGHGKDVCYTPDEAVLKVMEESGMSLAYKGRK